MQRNCIKTSHKVEQGEISAQELLCLDPGADRQLSWTLAASGKDLNNSTCLLRNLVKKQTWNNRLVPNWERSTSRLYFVTLLI